MKGITENTIEDFTTKLLEYQGYEYIYAPDIAPDDDSAEHNNYEEVLLTGCLREALLNAIVHKDYASGVPIQIRVYEDRIVFWSEGQLPDNWTIETLKKAHPSRPFNPDIANVFFRAGLIESWGRGIEKIETECKSHGLPSPEMTFEASSFMVAFDGSGILEKIKDRELPTEKGNVPEKTSEMSEIESEMSETTSEKMLDLIRENNRITIAQLSEIIGVSTRSIERNLKKLQDDNRLKRKGRTRGYWQILD